MPSQSERLLRLINQADPSIRRKFLQLVNAQKEVRSLEEIAALLGSGNIGVALNDLESLADGLMAPLTAAYQAAGVSSAAVLSASVPSVLEFNLLNFRAAGYLNDTRARLVRELTFDTRNAMVGALFDAQQRGLDLPNTARAVRGAIGLTSLQQETVQRFRGMLEANSAQVLQRQLRDKRFDGTIRRAIRGGGQLAPAQIERMTERFQERMLDHRARTIARTEALRAVHAGDEELWQQAIDAGQVVPDEIQQIWRTSGGATVRSSHRAMEGQTQPFKTPFISGDGNRLRFPADPQAPASDSINCHCVISRTVVREG